jgi:GntR family transcriptional repressor for pyruvate dehydrogenase complex
MTRDSRQSEVHEIARRLRDEIAFGRFRSGEPMPSLRVLAVRFSIGVSTVRTAIRRLADEGLVVTRAGQGIFVSADRPRPTAARRIALLLVDANIHESLSLIHI